MIKFINREVLGRSDLGDVRQSDMHRYVRGAWRQGIGMEKLGRGGHGGGNLVVRKGQNGRRCAHRGTLTGGQTPCEVMSPRRAAPPPRQSDAALFFSPSQPRNAKISAETAGMSGKKCIFATDYYSLNKRLRL